MAMWAYGVFAIGAAILAIGFILFFPRFRRRRAQVALQEARARFQRRREWLEARFMTLAARSGKPRGLRWADCEFENAVAFARDRGTGRLRALVAVTIKFEAIEGEGMEDVAAVANHKAATVVFRLDGPDWETDGRAYFNLSPSQTIDYYQSQLEFVE
jgi:uncharacterized membrane protein